MKELVPVKRIVTEATKYSVEYEWGVCFDTLSVLFQRRVYLYCHSYNKQLHKLKIILLYFSSHH